MGNFVYASPEAQALSVLGGYTAGCADRTLDPVNTILDGNQTGTVLRLSAPYVAAEFLVEGLTLRKGSFSGLRVVVDGGGEVLVDNNSISDNTTSSEGGGVYLSATTATLTNNDISGNTASSSSYGGGVYLRATSATLTNNDISGNTASSLRAPSYGGGASIDYETTATEVSYFSAH